MNLQPHPLDILNKARQYDTGAAQGPFVPYESCEQDLLKLNKMVKQKNLNPELINKEIYNNQLAEIFKGLMLEHTELTTSNKSN